ncbi:DUF4397 domain-containing protein [Desmospora profundinema]|uniref:DUF4397 domain-containing protein n=1 Tax=Desmospora profundinema TaxID=1571184 RepID=A0ABU1IKQ1_9BACL|nr:DUF4397 domain-containing protein [Desmospora profundinema]MDR6225127.1 hypothetical protein [Desmospora profundinema]
MDHSRELKRYLEKAQMYGLLAEYYKYSHPEWHVHYYKKHLRYTRRVAEMVQMGTVMGDGQQESQTEPSSVPRERTRVRILHASPGTAQVNVNIDGRRLATNLGYGNASNYIDLPPRTYRVEVFRRGEPVLQERVTLEAGNVYTLAAVNRPRQLELLTIVDDPEVEQGKVHLRFGHLSPDTPTVDVTISENIMYPDVRFKEVTRYLTVHPATEEVEVFIDDRRQKILTVPRVTFQANQAYSAYLIGLSQGRPRLNLLLLRDGR